MALLDIFLEFALPAKFGRPDRGWGKNRVQLLWLQDWEEQKFTSYSGQDARICLGGLPYPLSGRQKYIFKTVKRISFPAAKAAGNKTSVFAVNNSLLHYP